MTNQRSASGQDGRLFPATEADVKCGACLREVSEGGHAPPFSDLVVQDVFPVDKHGARVRPGELAAVGAESVHVVLVRPYAMVSGAGSACPTVLTGVETLTVDLKAITREGSRFRVLVTARGAVHIHTA